MKTGYEKSVRSIGLCALMAVFLMGSVWAQRAGADAGDRERGQKGFGQMVEKLKLTPDQKEKFDANREKDREEAVALREQMSAKQKELSQALEAVVLDRNNVNRIHGEYKALVAKKEDARLASILEIRSILTPDQFSQYQSMMSEKRGPKGEGAQKAGAKGAKGEKAGKAWKHRK